MTRLFSTTALVLAMGVMPAWADLTVDQAWNVWKAQAGALGLVLDASETRDGDTLRIGDIRLSAQFPLGTGTAYVTFAGPSFSPMGDGRIAVEYPRSSLLTVGGDITGQGSLAMALEVETGDSTYIMSGDPDNVTSDWNSTGSTLTLRDVAVSGQQAVDVSGDLTFGAFSMRNTTRITDSHVSINSMSKIDNYATTYALTIPDARAGNVGITGTDKAVNSNSRVDLVLPKSGLDMLALHEQLHDGLSMALQTVSASATSSQTTLRDGIKVAAQTAEIVDYDTSVRLDRAGLDYGGKAGAFNGDVLIEEFPIPVSMAGSGVDFRMLIPLLMGEGQDAAFRMGLHDLTLNDGFWDILDPESKLPRDPMSVVLDMGSKVSLLFEFLDIRALIGGAEPPAMPVMAKTATLNELHVAMAGAELSGTGDMSFDYNDWTTFDGIPAPEGEASFTLSGAHGLIDKLIEMGLLEQSDAMGTRMMLGMFTKPGEGNDVLTTRIEVKKTGEVLANGQRLQ